MKRLVVVLLILTPWVMHSMELEELKLKTLAKRYLEDKEEELPVPLPTLPSQIIAQKLLSQGLKGFILSHVSLPFKDCVGHTDPVWLVQLDSTGDKIVTGSLDGTAKIWDSTKGELVRTLPALFYALPCMTGDTFSAAFNPAGDKIVTTAHLDNVARVWDVGTGELLHILGHEDEVSSASFNLAGTKVVAASNRSARIWDIKTGAFLDILEAHTRAVWSAAFNPAGNKVTTGAIDGTAKIWNVETGALIHTFQGQNGVMKVDAFNPAGDIIVTTSEGDDAVRIWNEKTYALLHTLPGHAVRKESAKFNLAGNQLITCSADSTVKIWDVKTGALLHTFQGQLGKFSPAGDKVVTIVTTSEVDARIWDVKTGELLHSLKGFKGEVRSVEFSPAGNKVVVAFGNKARIWDLSPLLSCQKFLERAITLRQAVILNAIFETIRARGIVKALQEKAFEKAPLLSPEAIRFDFNTYPHLWDVYASLPEAIRRVFDPYVTKLAPSA